MGVVYPSKPEDNHVTSASRDSLVIYLPPSHILIRDIPDGLTTRIRRICSFDEIFEEQIMILKSNLWNPVYKAHTVQSEINEIVQWTGKPFCNTKTKQTQKRVPLINTYHSAIKNLKSIIRNICSFSTLPKNAWPDKDPLMAAFNRPSNLYYRTW